MFLMGCIVCLLVNSSSPILGQASLHSLFSL